MAEIRTIVAENPATFGRLALEDWKLKTCAGDIFHQADSPDGDTQVKNPQWPTQSVFVRLPHVFSPVGLT